MKIDDKDPNEDFICCHCGKPVQTRILYCSVECEKEDEKTQLILILLGKNYE